MAPGLATRLVADALALAGSSSGKPYTSPLGRWAGDASSRRVSGFSTRTGSPVRSHWAGRAAPDPPCSAASSAPPHPGASRVDEQQLQVVPPGQQGINLCPTTPPFPSIKIFGFPPSQIRRCSNVRSPGRPAFSVLIVPPRFPASHNGQAGISVGPGWRAVGEGKKSPAAYLPLCYKPSICCITASLDGPPQLPTQAACVGPRFDKNARRNEFCRRAAVGGGKVSGGLPFRSATNASICSICSITATLDGPP